MFVKNVKNDKKNYEQAGKYFGKRIFSQFLHGFGIKK